MRNKSKEERPAGRMTPGLFHRFTALITTTSFSVLEVWRSTCLDDVCDSLSLISLGGVEAAFPTYFHSGREQSGLYTFHKNEYSTAAVKLGWQVRPRPG